MILHSLAWAQANGAAPDAMSGIFSLIIPFSLIFILFYFLILKPQQNRQKEQQDMREALKKGEKVITTSGIWGTVTNLDKETVTLQIADNTKIRMQRDHIASIRKSNDS